jgi:hypothetical protein
MSDVLRFEVNKPEGRTKDSGTLRVKSFDRGCLEVGL